MKTIVTIVLFCFSALYSYSQDQLKLSIIKVTDKPNTENEHFYLLEITNTSKTTTSFNILASIILATFFPILSLGFFIGYSVHLIADSFTRAGIQPFWPLKVRRSGFITNGGRFNSFATFFLRSFKILNNSLSTAPVFPSPDLPSNSSSADS